MNYTYPSFVAAIVAETNIPATNAGFIAVLPTIIGQAEGRIYREPTLNFLSTETVDDSAFTTPNSQNFTLPQNFVVLEQVNLVQGNDRLPLEKIGREWLQSVYPRRIALSMSDVPTKWAPLTDNVVLLAPTPGGTWQIECVGQVVPPNMSEANPTNWLWTNLGDLAFAAAMVFASAYMRNFGAQADDPKMAMSWETTYQGLLPGASSQEMQRKHQASK